ncbi:MAG: SurA N-terminal domain-containing protein [Nitrospirae bacterium]|nr:SurA N-terminal domain-containing protein [Nitrospirota bacterium]
MLKIMRKHARYFYFLFFIVIITFIFWGVGTVDKTNSIEIIAEIGNYKITTEDYWRTYDNVYRFYKEIYKDKLDEEMEKKLNLRDKVLDSMINERILLLVSKEVGITVSDQELREAIESEPAFLKNGVFDKDIYANRLRLNRITPEIFEASKRQELVLTKMKRFIELSVEMPNLDIDIPQASENAQLSMMLRQTAFNEEKDKVIESYIAGLKRQMKIKINKDLIS